MEWAFFRDWQIMGFRVVVELYDVRGAEALLQGRILWHSSSESEEKQRIQSMPT